MLSPALLPGTNSAKSFRDPGKGESLFIWRLRRIYPRLASVRAVDEDVKGHRRPRLYRGDRNSMCRLCDRRDPAWRHQSLGGGLEVLTQPGPDSSSRSAGDAREGFCDQPKATQLASGRGKGQSRPSGIHRRPCVTQPYRPGTGQSLMPQRPPKSKGKSARGHNLI